ncbi:MAG TPA: integrase core domain-containing protein [Acidimicrobiales bacterium]|nr:integrase core domain-containing protein [Acidimicrobiales bacterium]
MDMGRFLIETHLRTGKPIKVLARTHGVSPSWLFKLLRRYRLEGPAGLEPRSRRPKSSPSRIADLYEDEIVTLRKELSDAGFDAGAATIHFHLSKRHRRAPSVPTIWRVLRARGFVTRQPKKRPKSSYTRFVADLPNERWQADMTHVTLPNGEVFEVLNIIDDHSRVCVASRAMHVVKAHDVVRVLHKSAGIWGHPASFLTDNGLIFTARTRYGVEGAVEQELFALGITAKHSRPYHPQTCGKVERFHQTLKKFLGAQKGIETKKQLQRAIDRFVVYYNDVRPHRGVGRQTPRLVFDARQKAQPTASLVKIDGRRLRLDKVDSTGSVTLRHRGRLHHIGIGRAYAGWRVAMLVAGLDIEVVGLDGSPLRRLVLDPTKDYQRTP